MTKLSLLILALVLGFIFWFNQNLFFEKYDGEKWFSLYQNSRYGRGDKSAYILSDDQTYAVKGYLFVTKNISLTNFEPGHPPFASYLMGIANLIFGNPIWANFIIGSLFFFCLYLFLASSTKPVLALIISLLFLSETIIYQQLSDTMLDIYQLFFALISVIFYSLWWRRSRAVFLWVSQFSVGLMLSTKFFLSGISLPIAMMLATTISGHFNRFKIHVLSLFALVIGFLVGHISFFFFDLSLLNFSRYQRYVLNWWAGSPQTPPFGVWDLLIFNRWHTWWDEAAILKATEWRLTWPIYILGGLVSLVILAVRKKLSPLVWFLWLWLAFVMAQLSFTAVFPRHLLFAFLPAILLLNLTLSSFLNKKSI